MELLFLIGSLECGGAERVLVDLANYWASKNWKISVATIAFKNTDYYHLSPAVQHISFETKYHGGFLKRLFPTIKLIIKIRKLLKTGQYAIVKSDLTTFNALLAISSLGLRKNIKLIASEHTHPPMYQFNSFVQWLILKLYKRFDSIVALTEKSANWLQTHGHFSNIDVIPNAITPTIFHATELVQHEQKQNQTQFKLLAAGRLHDPKGFDLLIPVFSKLSLAFPEWDLLIAGEGKERANLENLIQKHGLEKRVELLGAVADMSILYNTVDCFVLSSRREGFPLVLIEAMASGLPVISFDCDTGPRDIIRHDVDGLLIPAGDIQALYLGLSHLFRDKQLRRRLGEKAVEVRDRFSPEKIAVKWENLFEKVLRKKLN